MEEKNTEDDNYCCHDDFDQNFGNFDDNYDKKLLKILQKLLILGKILPKKSGNARIETFIFY